MSQTGAERTVRELFSLASLSRSCRSAETSLRQITVEMTKPPPAPTPAATRPTRTGTKPFQAIAIAAALSPGVPPLCQAENRTCPIIRPDGCAFVKNSPPILRIGPVAAPHIASTCLARRRT